MIWVFIPHLVYPGTLLTIFLILFFYLVHLGHPATFFLLFSPTHSCLLFS
ncbi:MAG TPA: hypothetical protein VLE96_05785 [Chlamydiales bacterium]|nr:hypothetical protein [Chlamydiales bacterium]